MKLKIWQDEKGARHTSLDDMEIGNILIGLNLENHPGNPSEVSIRLLSEIVEVEVDANVRILVQDNRYHLKSIN